jgi:response regulator RpfG family c-di-GMP phosphodiesterase
MTTILIIDDEDDIRLAVRAVLETQGYTVLDANNGKKGLEILNKGGIDLLILDFFMPEMNGREVLAQIREMDGKLKKLKVILLTVASFGKEGTKTLKDLKIADYIQKPFVNKEFIAHVKKVLA